MKTEKKFNKTAFVSCSMIITAISLPISGIMMHNLSSYIMSWEKHLWMTIHNISGLLFIIFAVWHIILHKRQLLNYIKEKSKLRISKEFIAAFSVVFILLLLSAFHTFHT